MATSGYGTRRRTAAATSAAREENDIVETAADVTTLRAMKLPELKALASRRSISFDKKVSKAALADKILKAVSATNTAEEGGEAARPEVPEASAGAGGDEGEGGEEGDGGSRSALMVGLSRTPSLACRPR